MTHAPMMGDHSQVDGDLLIGTLIDAFTNDSAEVRRDAAHVLARMGPQKQVVRALRKALKDDNAAIRYGASRAFQRMDFTSVAVLYLALAVDEIQKAKNRVKARVRATLC
jgi:HEAT repeat protein